MIDAKRLLAALLACGALRAVGAQKLPPIRPLGPITHVSTEPLASVAMAFPLSDGRVFANDIVARRVILFDSALATARVVTDSASVTATAYGFGAGALIPYRGDSALFLDPQSGAIPVLSPVGRIARIMAAPRPTGQPVSFGSLYFAPAFDAKGRLVHYLPLSFAPLRDRPTADTTISSILDSAIIVRYDFGTQALDTIASIKMPRSRQTHTFEGGRLRSIRSVMADPVPMVDEWVVRADGALVIVRGRDFHVDWMTADGKWSSAPKIPFEWQHLDDAQKQVLIDSAAAADKARRDSLMAAFAQGGSAAIGMVRSGRGGGTGDATRPPMPPPVINDPPLQPNDVWDYRPAFLHGSTKLDADGNLWIRTTTMVGGQPVYDVIDPRGVLLDRVQLPPFRTIAGFAPGVVLMAVKDSAGRVFLEKALIAKR